MIQYLGIEVGENTSVCCNGSIHTLEVWGEVRILHARQEGLDVKLIHNRTRLEKVQLFAAYQTKAANIRVEERFISLVLGTRARRFEPCHVYDNSSIKLYEVLESWKFPRSSEEEHHTFNVRVRISKFLGGTNVEISCLWLYRRTLST